MTCGDRLESPRPSEPILHRALLPLLVSVLACVCVSWKPPAVRGTPTTPAGAAPPSAESRPTTPSFVPDLRHRIEDLLRENERGLPQAWSVRPNPLRLRMGEVGVLLVSGVHLDQVVGAAVVSPSGAPSRTIRPLVYREPGSDTRTVLFVIVPAPPTVPAGEYRLQLNAVDGATYVPRDVGRLLIEEPHGETTTHAERPER